MDFQIPSSSNVQPGKALVMRYSQAREGLIKMDMEPVHRNVQVEPKKETHCGRSKDPIVGEHGCIVGRGLHSSSSWSSL